MYRPIRKDLTETTTKCHFCPKPLRSLTAYILQDVTTGEYVYAGPECAKKNVGNKDFLKKIPDFTRFTAPNKSDDKGSQTGKGTGSGGRTPLTEEDQRRKAIEYLELRVNKLAKDFSTSHEKLEEYYTDYKNSELSNEAIRHILNIDAFVKTNRTTI